MSQTAEKGIADLINNLFRIFRVAGAKCRVLDEPFPSKFHESDPLKIYESYNRFLKSKTDHDGSIKNEDKLPLTTITERNDKKEYNVSHGGLYKLYHDIKLVCIMLINYFPQGSKKYQMVDKFYKFATELMLREAYKIGAQLVYETNLDDDERETDSSRTELEKAISADFIKIATNYTVPVTETYHITTKDLELFSSTIERSEIDYRPHELPNSNFEINKVIPQTSLLDEAPKLGFLAANTSGIPDPTLPPTEMMTRFLHPNWYALPTTVWLKYNGFSSWAPSFNENGTVIDSTTKGTIWLNRVGYMQELIKKEKQLHEDLSKEQETTKDEEKKTDMLDDADLDQTKKNEKTANEAEVKTEEGNLRNDSNNNIKIENLFAWTPSNQLTDSDIALLKDGKGEQLVNDTLSRIARLRKSRIAKRLREPTDDERNLYFKARLLLKEIMLSKTDQPLKLSNHTSFPIVQVNYNGTIPVVRTQPVKKKKYRR